MIFTIGLSLLAAGMLVIIFTPVTATERMSAECMPNWKAFALFAASISAAAGCFCILISVGILAIRHLP